MAGTREGGLRAYKKIIEKDPDFYRRIGALGGKKKGDKGFAIMDKDKVRAAGSKGGKISRLPHRKNMTELETKVEEEVNGIR